MGSTTYWPTNSTASLRPLNSCTRRLNLADSPFFSGASTAGIPSRATLASGSSLTGL